MPESQQPIEGQQIMISRIISGKCSSVLDVGAGDGRWGTLLRGLVGKVTAIEAWPEYVERYRLRKIYDEVIIGDVRNFNGWGGFDVIIFGDVLEHMPRTDSTKLIELLKKNRLRAFLTIPISPCPQDGTVYKNPFETHQDQWTHEELEKAGWLRLHQGLNPNGKVTIGTYALRA